jgi:hypothetical protein
MRGIDSQIAQCVDLASPASKRWWAAACHMLHGSRVTAPFRTRTGRRWLVGMYLLDLAAFPILGWLTDQLWLVMVNVIPFVVGALLLAVATQGILDRPERSLDERQIQLRRRIFGEPYFAGLCVGLAGGLIVAAATGIDDEPMLAGVVLLVIGFGVCLPSLALAWSLPKEPDNDE